MIELRPRTPSAAGDERVLSRRKIARVENEDRDDEHLQLSTVRTTQRMGKNDEVIRISNSSSNNDDDDDIWS